MKSSAAVLNTLRPRLSLVLPTLLVVCEGRGPVVVDTMTLSYSVQSSRCACSACVPGSLARRAPREYASSSRHRQRPWPSQCATRMLNTTMSTQRIILSAPNPNTCIVETVMHTHAYSMIIILLCFRWIFLSHA